MPRDSSGNYTLPLGNPVIDGTVIDVNWANPTMNDIAVQLNNVLTRDGLLGPTLPFYLVDGSAAIPGLGFASSNNTGLFRPGGGGLGVTVGGVEVARFLPTGPSFAFPVSIPVGSAAAPGLAFVGDPDTGLYSPGANIFGVAGGGVERFRIDGSGLTTFANLVSSSADPNAVATLNLISNDRICRLNAYHSAHAVRPNQFWVNAVDPTGIVVLATANAERMRIDDLGNLLVGVTSASGHAISKARTVDINEIVLSVTRQQTGTISIRCFAVSQEVVSSAATALAIGRAASTLRSVNAAGTLNASGADYAEYEPCGDLVIAKGDIVGFKADGSLTLTFAEAVRFGIKSSDPSFVGGDVWGTPDIIGKQRPVRPELSDPAEQAAALAQYEVELAAFDEALEAVRKTVDRVAYSGKVPVNVLGAVPGDYIVASEAADGSIVGAAEDSPTFEQYRLAVGRVNRILPDGRAEVAVIMH